MRGAKDGHYPVASKVKSTYRQIVARETLEVITAVCYCLPIPVGAGEGEFFGLFEGIHQFLALRALLRCDCRNAINLHLISACL